MFLPRLLVVFLATAFALSPCGFGATPKNKKASADAEATAASGAYKGAIVMDADSGQVLFEDRPDVVTPPASVTKLMTFLVVHDRIKAGTLALDTPVVVTADIAKFAMKSDSTAVWLKEKETFTVDELLYAMMVQSANDGALALSKAASGSSAAFVEAMNAKAKELGMTNSTFRTPHGLPPPNRNLQDGDLTSPRDLALLSRELLKHTDVLKYTSVKERSFGGDQRPEAVIMRNHNHLLGKVAGVDGLKTGYTRGAGFCLAATAERNGRRVIAVVMGSPASKLRDLKVTELLARGFAALPAAPASPISASTSTPPASPVASAPAASPVRPATATPAPTPNPGTGIVFPGVKPTRPSPTPKPKR